MTWIKKYLIGIILLIFSFPALVKAETTIVYGEGFSFGLKVPNGWVCEGSGPSLTQMNANAILHKKGETIQNAKALIFIKVNSSEDDKVDEDLKYDFESYKKKYPGAELKKPLIKHPEYKTAAGLFYIKSVSAEYVTYVSPIPFVHQSLSIAMNIQKREATPSELKAYSTVTNSILWLSNKVITK